MTLHEFVLIVDDTPTRQQVDAWFAMEDELHAGVEPGSGEIWFDREAPSLVDAIASAVHDLERLGLRPVRVEHRDWMTLGKIAHQIGRSREIVRLWSTGRLGPGGFPPPLNPDPGARTAFYSWAEVAPWLRGRMELVVPDEEPARVAANLALQLRALAPRVERMDGIRDLVTGGPGSTA